ncbi:ABC transporter substrate-binding protein [Rhodococcus sp. NPDC127530]|uniref:ABC transporter substrate-binding protein n=1 Tax=unclassified Rhodococcus (in: high G+C Gram-positive bacteria) TaxID=192944 RepID=UPI00363B758B
MNNQPSTSNAGVTAKRWIRRVAGATAIVLATVGLAACRTDNPTASSEAQSWDSVMDSAADEGVVNFYSVAPELQNVRLVEAFNSEYPDIKVRVLRGGGELPSRVSAEIQSGSKGADVFLFSDPNWFTKNADHLMALKGPEAECWPAQAWRVKDKAVVPSAYPFGMIVWNTDLFPDGFHSWDDLLDPSVKGKFGTRSDVTPSYAGYLDFLERTMGPAYLPALGAQDPKFYPSVVPMTQAVASGEIGVANTTTPSIVKDLQEMGAPVDAVVPPHTYAIEWGAAAIDGSEHSNAARVFMDFMMSQRGQQALNGDGLGISGRTDIPGVIPQAGMEMLESEKYPAEVLAEWSRKVDEYLS